MRYRYRALYVWALLLVSSPLSHALDPHDYIERAVTLIESEDFELARTYLAPALIDYRLTSAERARAYYLHGYSFFAESLYVSAGKDYHRALEFDPYNPVVLTALGHLLFEGLGTDPNPKLAVMLFEQAAEAGYPTAELRLGHAYLQGMGVAQDVERARGWLESASDQGLAAAMMHMAQSYREPYAADPDPQRAMEWYQRAHAAGAVDALAYVGFIIESGELDAAEAVDAEDTAGTGDVRPDNGISEDRRAERTAQAREHFERAAAAGSAVAQAKLGHQYLVGDGVEADFTRAEALFAQAAEQGHPTGYMGLGYLHESGLGRPTDPAQALTWYRQAAEAGVVDAQLRLAHHELRQPTREGHQRALHWLIRAAAQDSVQALNDSAWLLATSPHDPVRNGQQAVTLAQQAVERQRDPNYLDTLAAAYAETGKFDRAIETQQEALALAAEDDTALRAELESHLHAFQARKPWRE